MMELKSYPQIRPKSSKNDVYVSIKNKKTEISKAMELLSISGEDIESYFFKKKARDTEQE